MNDPLLEIAQGVAALRYRLDCENNVFVNTGGAAGCPERAAERLARQEAVALTEAQRLGFTADELRRVTEMEVKRLEAHGQQTFLECMKSRL